MIIQIYFFKDKADDITNGKNNGGVYDCLWTKNFKKSDESLYNVSKRIINEKKWKKMISDSFEKENAPWWVMIANFRL